MPTTWDEGELRRYPYDLAGYSIHQNDDDYT